MTIVGKRRRKKSSPEDFVENFDQAKSLEKHNLFITIIKYSLILFASLFIVVLLAYLYQAYTKHELPAITDISSYFSIFAEIIKVAMGVQS